MILLNEKGIFLSFCITMLLSVLFFLYFQVNNTNGCLEITKTRDINETDFVVCLSTDKSCGCRIINISVSVIPSVSNSEIIKKSLILGSEESDCMSISSNRGQHHITASWYCLP